MELAAVLLRSMPQIAVVYKFEAAVFRLANLPLEAYARKQRSFAPVPRAGRQLPVSTPHPAQGDTEERPSALQQQHEQLLWRHLEAAQAIGTCAVQHCARRRPAGGPFPFPPAPRASLATPGLLNSTQAPLHPEPAPLYLHARNLPTCTPALHPAPDCMPRTPHVTTAVIVLHQLCPLPIPRTLHAHVHVHARVHMQLPPQALLHWGRSTLQPASSSTRPSRGRSVGTPTLPTPSKASWPSAA